MSILTADELAAVRRDYRAATLLPARAYHDPRILDWEREHILRRDWLQVAREEDVPDPGSFQLIEVEDENVLLVRGRDGVIRAFYNVCRHRGTAVEERACGKAVRFQCPYHAWIYDLDGSLVRAKHTDDLDDFSLDTFGLTPIRCDTWQGFVFLNMAESGEPLSSQIGDIVDNMARFDFAALRSARRIEYEVAANWKLIAENYSECYHCPGVHPQLNKLTPYDLGGDFEPDGAWQGGWMELVGEAETMALDGGHGSRAGRPPMCGIDTVDEKRIYYYVLWPLTFLSIHPDYLLVHRLVPRDPGHTLVVCDWLFEQETIARPGFDPADAVAFWDLTNRQDWHVCELQQQGTRSRSWVAGRYSTEEASVHAFDLMVADRYASDGVVSHRVVRDRHDAPPPRREPGHHHLPGTDGDGHGAHGDGDHEDVGHARDGRKAARVAARSKAG
jgi:phenylpropionate dioxygenase-like ring-hydroxylating dioxygenase large terminal subunit